jgi:hypothetical protein
MNNLELVIIGLSILVNLACVGFCLFSVRLNYKLYTEYFKDRSISNRSPK